MKVLLGGSSNPTPSDLFFQDHLLSQVNYIGLVIEGVGSNPKLVTFSLLG